MLVNGKDFETTLFREESLGGLTNGSGFGVFEKLCRRIDGIAGISLIYCNSRILESFLLFGSSFTSIPNLSRRQRRSRFVIALGNSDLAFSVITTVRTSRVGHGLEKGTWWATYNVLESFSCCHIFIIFSYYLSACFRLLVVSQSRSWITSLLDQYPRYRYRFFSNDIFLFSWCLQLATNLQPIK